MHIEWNQENINFVICFTGMIIMAIMFTYMLNEVDAQGEKKSGKKFNQ